MTTLTFLTFFHLKEYIGEIEKKDNFNFEPILQFKTLTNKRNILRSLFKTWILLSKYKKDNRVFLSNFLVINSAKPTKVFLLKDAYEMEHLIALSFFKNIQISYLYKNKWAESSNELPSIKKMLK
jgi:hypothetical protein